MEEGGMEEGGMEEGGRRMEEGRMEDGRGEDGGWKRGRMKGEEDGIITTTHFPCFIPYILTLPPITHTH